MNAPSPDTFAGGAGLSGHLDPLVCARQACEQVTETLAAHSADLVLIFASGRHARSMGSVGEIVVDTLKPGTLVGVSAEGVLCGRTELEREAGVAILALSLPGVQLQPFTSDDLPAVKDVNDTDVLGRIAQVTGVGADTRAILFFGDPFSTPLLGLMPALSRLHEVSDAPSAPPIIGGMASAAGEPGQNALMLNNRIRSRGGVGVSISGPVTIDTVVSQGCRPIGEPMLITKARRNIILSLGNRPALEALHDTVNDLGEDERDLLRNGLFIGRAVDEYKEHLGRGDFLIRAVMGVEETNSAMAVGDIVHVGQTVQLHVRDAASATEDLEILMSAQSLLGPAFAALACTCNGRGSRLFDQPSHDAVRIASALRSATGETPVAGFFAAGELGPVGHESFLHGHTASVAIFRPGAPAVDAD